MTTPTTPTEAPATNGPKKMSPWGWVGIIAIGGILISFAWTMIAGNLAAGANMLFQNRWGISYTQGLIFLSALGILLIAWIAKKS